MFVDNAAMKIIQQPKYFDVMVTENYHLNVVPSEGTKHAPRMTQVLTPT